MARKASIDHPRIFCVVVREDARGGQKNREQHSENGQTKTGGPKTFQDADAQTLAPSGWNPIVSQVGTAKKASEEVAQLRNGHTSANADVSLAVKGVATGAEGVQDRLILARMGAVELPLVQHQVHMDGVIKR